MSYREGDDEGRSRLTAFRDSLRESGWVESRNLSLDVRWLEGRCQRSRVGTISLKEHTYPKVTVVHDYS